MTCLIYSFGHTQGFMTRREQKSTLLYFYMLYIISNCLQNFPVPVYGTSRGLSSGFLPLVINPLGRLKYYD